MSGSACTSETDRSCAEIENDVQELLTSHKNCELDEDCIQTSVNVKCVPHFCCGTILNKETDIDLLSQHAKDLSHGYSSQCGCVMCMCINPDTYNVVCKSGICTADYAY